MWLKSDLRPAEIGFQGWFQQTIGDLAVEIIDRRRRTAALPPASDSLSFYFPYRIDKLNQGFRIAAMRTTVFSRSDLSVSALFVRVPGDKRSSELWSASILFKSFPKALLF